jgi:hypothetical protein
MSGNLPACHHSGCPSDSPLEAFLPSPLNLAFHALGVLCWEFPKSPNLHQRDWSCLHLLQLYSCSSSKVEDEMLLCCS